MLMTLRKTGRWVLTWCRKFAIRKFIMNMSIVYPLLGPLGASRPGLTVPLLLRTDHSEDPEGESRHEREQDPRKAGTSRGLFFWFQHSRTFKYLITTRAYRSWRQGEFVSYFSLRGQFFEPGRGGTCSFLCS